MNVKEYGYIMNDIATFLAETQPQVKGDGWYSHQDNRPGLICKDGFIMSVQASQTHYCDPRVDGFKGQYSEVEIGYPSEAEDLLMQWVEDADNPTSTVYGYVPVEVVDQVIRKHGGIVGEVTYR